MEGNFDGSRRVLRYLSDRSIQFFIVLHLVSEIFSVTVFTNMTGEEMVYIIITVSITGSEMPNNHMTIVFYSIFVKHVKSNSKNLLIFQIRMRLLEEVFIG